MAQRLTPSEPGADFLDDAIGRLRAMKTTVGLVLARALEAAHSRFLVFGSTLATLAGKVDDLERRDNISWPALDERIANTEQRVDLIDTHLDRRLTALEERVAGIRTPIEQATALQALTERVERLEEQTVDAMIRAGMSARSEAANATATRALLRAALSVLDPPLSYRELAKREATHAPDPRQRPGDITGGTGT